jgi:hypothetical protein
MMFNVIHVFRNCLIVQRDDVSKHQQRDDIRLELGEVSTEIGRVAHPCASTGVGAPSFRALCDKDGPPAAWPKKPLDAGLLAKLTGDLELVGYEDRDLNDSQTFYRQTAGRRKSESVRSA